MLPSISLSQKVHSRGALSSRDPGEVAHLKKIFKQSRGTRHRPQFKSVGSEAKLNFYKEYHDLKRVRERISRDNIQASASVALLTSTEKLQLRPLPLGIVKARGQEGQVNIRSGLSERYAEPFSEALKRMVGLERVNLKGSKLSTQASLKVLASINQSSLKQLNLKNNKVGHEGVERITQLIADPHSQLQTINLEASKISEAGVETICKVLLRNKRVLRLSLAKNALGPRVGKALGEMLKYNSSLRVLDLHWNKLSPAGATELFAGMRSNRGLKELDVSWNAIGHASGEAVRSLAKMLRNNKTLAHLDLSFNSFNSADCAVLAKALEDNHSVLGIHTLGNACTVNCLGFIRVEEAIDARKNPYAHRRVLTNEKNRPGENCWVCEKWVESCISFPEPENSQGPFFVHLAIDQFQPVPMKSEAGVSTYTRALPPSGTQCFVSDLQGRVHVLKTFSKASRILEETFEYYPGWSRRLELLEMNEFKPSGESRYVVSGKYQFMPRYPLEVYVPPAQEVVKEPWDFNKSLFKDYVQDTPQLLNKCFEFDWKHCKIPNLIKDEEELAKCKELLRQNYPALKNLYKALSTCSFGEYFSVSSNIFFDMLGTGGVFNAVYGASDFGVNWNAATLQKVKGQLYNPGNALVRYEFLELVTRVAYDKYYRSKQCSSVYEGIQLLLEELDSQIYLGNFCEFRKRYYCEECEVFLLSNMQLLNAVYAAYSGRKTLPGKKKFMSLEEFRDLCLAIGLEDDGSTTRDVDQAYCFAMMTQIDELFSKRHLEMNKLEYFEALARLSDSNFRGEQVPLDQKLDLLKPRLANLVGRSYSKKTAPPEEAKSKQLG